MVYIMLVSVYTYWMRFKNVLAKTSRWLEVVLGGERLGSSNKH